MKSDATRKGSKMSSPVSSTLRFAALSIALTVAAAPVATAAVNAESKEYFEKARALTGKGDFSGSIIQLKNALRASSDNNDARFELGVLYLRTGDFASAQRELQTVYEAKYDLAKVVPPLTQSYLALGRYQEMIKNFNASTFPPAVRGTVLAAQARAQIALQDPKAARALVDAALALPPLSSGVIAADAILLRMEQKYKEAEAQVDKGLAAEPDQSELLVLKGELRQQQNDLDGAMTYFNRAVDKYPRFTRARVARSMVNLTRNQYDLIEDDVKDVLAQEPQNPIALYLRAFLLSQKKNYKDAIQILLAVPQLLENYPPARYLLAATAFADGQVEVARANAEQFVQKMPDQPTGIKLLAAIAQRSGDYVRAVSLLEPLAQREPNDAQLQTLLAGAYLAAGRSTDAITMFERGVSQDPNNVEAQLALAVSRLRAGETEAGVAQLETMAQKGTSPLQASTLLVLTHMRARQFDKAVQASESYIKSAPNDANGYNLKGTVSLAANDLPAARTAFRAAAAKDPKFVAAPLNLAKVEERANNLPEARRWYEAALKVEPKNVTAFTGLASLAMAEKDVNRAAGHLEKAIGLNADNLQLRQQLVDLLLTNNETNRALIAAREFANAAPNDTRALDALGRAQLAGGDFTNAIGSYQRMTKQQPQNAETHRRLGRALMAAANAKPDGKPSPNRSVYLADARVAFDQAVVTAPDYEAALIDRVTIERETAGDDKAVALAQKYVSERPDSVVRLIVMGDLQSVLRKDAAAAAVYRTAWEKEKTNNVLRRYYGALARSGKADEGLALLKTWVAEHPKDYDMRFLLTSVHIDAGRYKEALAETQAMDGVLPENPVLLNNLAWLLSQNKDPKAFEMAEKARQLAPEAPEILDTLGWLEVTSRNQDKGLELLTKAYGLAPNRPEIAYHYAAALRKKGDTAKAREVLQKALESKAQFQERKEAEALLIELRK